MMLEDGADVGVRFPDVDQNAPTYEVARKVASSIATSSLVKTAMYGEGESRGRRGWQVSPVAEDVDPWIE